MDRDQYECRLGANASNLDQPREKIKPWQVGENRLTCRPGTENILLDQASICLHLQRVIIQPRIRGFISLTTHPQGCQAHVRDQIGKVRGRSLGESKRVLVIGASTGYGLSARITEAFACGSATLGIFFARPPQENKLATAGWYNTVAFEREAAAEGLYARNLHGDAFSDETKKRAVAMIKHDWGQVDRVIYSLASPRRDNPRTGKTSKSCLKTIGQPYTVKTLDTDRLKVHEITIEAASEEEVSETVSVMGGEDWEWWMEALASAGVLAPECQTFSFSYVGPDLTLPIYRHGTIGRAKEDLEETAGRLRKRFASTGGEAHIVISKALVTQASSAIPVMPLYIALLYKVMKKHGLHEGCIEQMERLYASPGLPDGQGRIRIDDREMSQAVQSEVAALWSEVTTENVERLADVVGYRTEFLRLFGFGFPAVDYDLESDPLMLDGKPAMLAV